MSLGISIYPLMSSKEENLEYILKASKLGFKRVFTSMLEVSEDKEEALKQVDSYREILTYARNLGMRVFIDINPSILKIIGVNPNDLNFFVNLGVTGIRLDGMFNGVHESLMTYNEYDLEIEINGSFNISYVNNIIDLGCKKEKLVVCHNFYPEEYTGLPMDYFMGCMDRHKALGLKTASFVNSLNGGSLGPWPTNDGLPTLERHRRLDILAQAQELMALGVDDIIIGNAFATDDELEALSNLDKDIITLKIKKDIEFSHIEKSFMNKILKERLDSSEFIIRHSQGRFDLKDETIPSTTDGEIIVKKGAILINNDNYLNYKGELIIAREDIKIDNRRNVIGYIEDDFIELLKYIKHNKRFKLI